MLIAGAIANAPKPAKAEGQKNKQARVDATPWESLRSELDGVSSMFGGQANTQERVTAFKSFCLDVAANKTAEELQTLHGYTNERILGVLASHAEWLKANGWHGDCVAMGIS